MEDPLFDFLTQGPIVRLLLATCAFGLLWLGLIVLVQRRDAERRRRRREGLPPLPNIFKQLILFIQGEPSSPGNSQAGEMQAATGPPPYQPASPQNLPVPDLDMLTGNLANEPQVETPSRIPDTPSITVDDGEPEIMDSIPYHEATEDEIEDSAVLNSNDSDIPADAVEVMRVWRDLSDGSLIIEMNNTRFYTVGEMNKQGLARRFITLVRDLVSMAHIGAQAAGLPRPDFESSTAVVPQPGDWNQSNSGQELPSPSLDFQEEANPGLSSDIKGAIKASEAREDTGIAGQIEEFLQYRLLQSPAFKHRDIHVRPAHDGSLRIQVDDRYYEAVGDIIDPDVRAFIQNVIREWEARQ